MFQNKISSLVTRFYTKRQYFHIVLFNPKRILSRISLNKFESTQGAPYLLNTYFSPETWSSYFWSVAWDASPVDLLSNWRRKLREPDRTKQTKPTAQPWRYFFLHDTSFWKQSAQYAICTWKKSSDYVCIKSHTKLYFRLQMCKSNISVFKCVQCTLSSKGSQATSLIVSNSYLLSRQCPAQTTAMVQQLLTFNWDLYLYPTDKTRSSLNPIDTYMQAVNLCLNLPYATENTTSIHVHKWLFQIFPPPNSWTTLLQKGTN